MARKKRAVQVSGKLETDRPSLVVSIFSVFIAAIAIVISILSYANSRKQLDLDSAPKFGLQVFFQDQEELDDEDKVIRQVELYNNGAPLRSVSIEVVPYYKIYEARRIYDEEAQCPIGISTDVYYFPIERLADSFYIYRSGSSEGTIATITESKTSSILINKLMYDAMNGISFGEDISGWLGENNAISQKIREYRDQYFAYTHEDDYDFELKTDRSGNEYYYGHYRCITAINLMYFLNIDYVDYLGKTGKAVYNVCTGYKMNGLDYYYSLDLAGVEDISDEEIYRRINEYDYHLGYYPDEAMDKGHELDIAGKRIRYTSNILEYMLSDHEIRQHINDWYVSDEGYSWEW